MNAVDPIRSRKAIQAISTYLREKSPRDYLLFKLGINTALRASDLLTLRAKDVFEYGAPKDNLVVTESKTGKTRIIPLNDSAKEAILFYAGKADDFKIEPETYLFPSEKTGLPITRGQFWRLVNDWAKLVGLEGKYGCHSLRKTFGSTAWRANQPIESIQRAFNHSSPAVTCTYLGITQKDVENVYYSVNL